MSPNRLRFAPWVYTLLVLLCGIGYAEYSNYQLDGDAVSFMDIADAIRQHNLPLVVNGYWNPGYPFVLAIAKSIAKPSRWNELHVFYLANFFIFAACVGAMLFFVASLCALREAKAGDEFQPTLSRPALQLIGLAGLLASATHELPLGAVRADTLLLLFFLLAGGILARLLISFEFKWFPLLGLTLGCAYLTKSFAFIPSVFLFAVLFFWGLRMKSNFRVRVVGGAVVAGVIFLALAGPYIYGISEQRGRLTTGDSARLNYAFFVDKMERWHEVWTGKMGHATGPFKHPEKRELASPAVYTFDQHPVGTFPLWFDPAYWTDGATPHFWLAGQLRLASRTFVLLIRYLIGHLELFLVLAVLLSFGNSFSRHRRKVLALLPFVILGLSFFATYFPVDFQDRYLAAALFLVTLPPLALLVRREGEGGYQMGSAVAMLLAVLILANATADILERRRQLALVTSHGGAWDSNVWQAAEGLEKLGIEPGTPIACIGTYACINDPYWAHLAGTPIRAQIEVEPDASDPGRYWQSLPNKQEVVDLLRSHQLAAIVGIFKPAAKEPDGWQELGTGNFYVYMLNAKGTR